MSDTTDPVTLYTINDVAKILDKEPEWVAVQARAGRIPSRKIGRARRFTAQDVADYIEFLRQQVPS